MIPPFIPKRPNLSELANKFAPEIKAISETIENHSKEGIQHLANITSSKDELKKAASHEIVELINEGPSKTIAIIESVATQAKNASQKALDIMKESENPFIQQTAQKVGESPIFKPDDIIDGAVSVIKDTIQTADAISKDLEKEVIKEVIKSKVKKGFFDNKFFNFFKNIFIKIKNFFACLFKKDTTLNN